MKSINTVNACDYDQMTLYKPGEFNSKYKTDLKGKLKRKNKQILPDSVAETFLNSYYETCETLEDIILYRVFGKYIGKDTGKEYGAEIILPMYSVFCPECQCSDIHKFENDEREEYTFAGSKGEIYTMQYKCLNSKCGYMW